MRIWTYLILSYLAIILVVTFGMLLVIQLAIDSVSDKNLVVAETAIKAMADSNYDLSEKILTDYGEKIVELKAEATAKEISHLLGGQSSYDYARIREDDNLRKIGAQDIHAGGEVAGYLTLGDRTGVAILHPNKSVEGRNFAEWKVKFPDLWKYVERSFTEPRVKGYYTFVDRDNRVRKKFMVLVQVPRTPFTVAAVVNIDSYFLPVHRQIRQAGEKEMIEAKRSIQQSSQATLENVRLMGLAGGLVLLGLGSAFGLWFAAYISAPIMRLRDGVKQMGTGDFSVGVAEEGAREVKYLAQSFNHLGKQLIEYIDKRDFIRDTFGRYLTQEVANRLLESQDGLKLGGETREISMIMSDLRGFTALTSNRNPEQVIAFLNRYLGKMVEILLDYRGVIDEIIGDGILAFFGAPEPLEDHPARAVACALQMQAAMDEVNAENEAEGLPPLEMGIAVNTGHVVVGNIGSEKRAKYGAVGSEVNFTGRAESFTVGGQVLITETTHERLSEVLDVRDVLKVEMKGISGEVRLYDVRGIRGTYEVHLPEKDEPLVSLQKKIDIRIFRMDKKIVTAAETTGSIIRASRTSAVVVLHTPVNQWEDLRIELLDETMAPVSGSVYAKVVSVTGADETYEAEIRFTSVSPEALKVLSQESPST